MLLKKTPAQNDFQKNIRNRIMSDEVPRKSVAEKNRTELLLKKLTLKTFVKSIRSRMLLEKVSVKQNRTEMPLGKLPLKNVFQKHP